MGIHLAIPFFAFSQSQNVPLNQSFSVELERRMIASEQIIHNSFKPVLLKETKEKEAVSALTFSRAKDKNWVARKLFYEHFIALDTGMIQLTIDPLVNFELSEEFEDADPREITRIYNNTRGFNLRLLIGEKIAVESSFLENQAILPYFLDQRTRLLGVAYGQGGTKVFKDDGFDFAMASSYVSYSPSDRVNIQIGHGKHFVGNGHRSLLLSDVAFNYPFLKVNTNWFDNKLQYQNLYALFQDLDRLESNSFSQGLFERKQGAIHYLEYSPNHRWSIGLFENTIFPSLDSSGNIPVGVNYWVPVIFLNTLIERDNEIGNSMLGINFNYNLLTGLQLYGQYASVGEKANYQIGTKVFPHKNLLIQAEFNSLSASNRFNESLFYHYNESLTHPVFYETSELVGILQYQKERLLTRSVVNILLDEISDLASVDLRQSYIINPSFNFTIHAGVRVRYIENYVTTSVPTTNINTPSTIVYLGLSTNLQNLYFNY